MIFYIIVWDSSDCREGSQWKGEWSSTGCQKSFLDLWVAIWRTLTAQVNEVSRLHNGGYIFIHPDAWAISYSFFHSWNGIRIVILGTDHLLCFWNITCVATEKEVFPIVLDASWLVLNLPLALETLWAKRGGPFKQLAFAGRGPGRGGHSDSALWAPPLEEVLPSGPAAPGPPPARYSCWFWNIRALTSPCLGSVSVKLRWGSSIPCPCRKPWWTEQGTFLAYQRLRRWKSVNNASFSELKPGVSALLLGGDSGPRVLVRMCSDWVVPTTWLCLPWFLLRVRRGLLLPEYNLVELDGYNWIQCLWALDAYPGFGDPSSFGMSKR